MKELTERLWDGELCVSINSTDGIYVDAYIYYRDKNGDEHEICCVTGTQTDEEKALTHWGQDRHTDTYDLVSKVIMDKKD